MESLRNELSKLPLDILLIEDSDGDAFLIQEALTENSGNTFTVSHVTSVEEAEQKYKIQPYHVMLLDLNLPGFSGMDAVEKVRRDQPGTPIIVMTGLDDEKKATSAMQRGVQDYLVKGQYGNDVLPRAIRYAIERKRFENRMIELVNFDQITGLINREVFLGRLEGALAPAQQKDTPLVVLLVNLRHFKDVNATLGHEIGNALLKAVATRLKSCVMPGDAIARLEGDEFMLLVTGDTATPGNLPDFSQRVIGMMRQPFEIDGHFITIGCNIGIASYPACGKDGIELARNADIALHRAKQNDKDEFQFYTQKLNEELNERVHLERELRDALKQRQILAYYQPIIDLTTNRVCGLETLLRWQHPEKGLIPPTKFIPIAEKTDLILEISEYVMQLACSNYPLWKSLTKQPFYVAVNLSTKDLRKKDFTDRLGKILSDTDMDPKHLALEITEGTIMEDSAQTILALKKCRELGASIFVDDFGTGYSSLSYLSILPLDILKIDRSFVTDIMTNAHNRLIATSTINLAQGLGLKVVAEGIETKEQKDLLASLGCDKAQGYYFAKPMPAKELTEWLGAYKKAA